MPQRDNPGRWPLAGTDTRQRLLPVENNQLAQIQYSTVAPGHVLLLYSNTQCLVPKHSVGERGR